MAMHPGGGDAANTGHGKEAAPNPFVFESTLPWYRIPQVVHMHRREHIYIYGFVSISNYHQHTGI